MAKQIIKLFTRIAEVVNNDPDVGDKLRLVFLGTLFDAKYANFVLKFYVQILCTNLVCKFYVHKIKIYSGN